MKLLKNIISSLLLFSVLTAVAVTETGKETQCVVLPQPRVVMNVTVMDINNTNRDGVTRITCDLEGVPHTSQRIDKAQLFVKGHVKEAFDIDGVDFERYFQWEDDGVVEIEIDFPLTKNLSANDSIKFHTVHGIYTTKIGSAATAKKK